VSLLGISWGTILVLGLALWIVGRRPTYALLAAIVIDGALKMALNQVLHVPRPAAPSIITYEQLDIGSFPSGHTATAAVLWGYLSISGFVPWLVTAAVVLLVALSRMYLGVHYVGDILGGLLLAAIVLWITLRAWPPVRDRLGRLPHGVLDAAALLVVAGVAACALFVFGDNPFQWRAGGMIAGFAIALPLELRVARPRRTGTSGWLVAAVGAAGIGMLAAIDVVTGESSDTVGVVTTLLASVWALLVVPLLFGTPAHGRASPDTAAHGPS
jgi:membrane-associated phospholipid phosphatase